MSDRAPISILARRDRRRFSTRQTSSTNPWGHTRKQLTVNNNYGSKGNMEAVKTWGVVSGYVLFLLAVLFMAYAWSLVS